MNYRLTREADKDVVAIYMYGAAEFGIAQADAYHDQLENVFGFLAENPRAARLRSEFDPPMRIHPFKAHLVFYVEEDSDIVIVRVRHGREDWIAEAGQS